MQHLPHMFLTFLLALACACGPDVATGSSSGSTTTTTTNDATAAMVTGEPDVPVPMFPDFGTPVVETSTTTGEGSTTDATGSTGASMCPELVEFFDLLNQEVGVDHIICQEGCTMGWDNCSGEACYTQCRIDVSELISPVLADLSDECPSEFPPCDVVLVDCQLEAWRRRHNSLQLDCVDGTDDLDDILTATSAEMADCNRAHAGCRL